MNNVSTNGLKSPACAGLLLFLVFLLSGCQLASTPEQVTKAFWTAISNGDIQEAEQLATEDSRSLLVSSAQEHLKVSTIETGKILIDGNIASVETIINSQDPKSKDTFLTELKLENEHWKIDYRKTLTNQSNNIFGGFFKSLQNFGEQLNKKLEQEIPKLEKDIEAIGNELEKQMDEFGRKLEEALPPPPKPKQPPERVI